MMNGKRFKFDKLLFKRGNIFPINNTKRSYMDSVYPCMNTRTMAHPHEGTVAKLG